MASERDLVGSGTLDVNEVAAGKLRDLEAADKDGDGMLTIEEAEATLQ